MPTLLAGYRIVPHDAVTANTDSRSFGAAGGGDLLDTTARHLAHQNSSCVSLYRAIHYSNLAPHVHIFDNNPGSVCYYRKPIEVQRDTFSPNLNSVARRSYDASRNDSVTTMGVFMTTLASVVALAAYTGIEEPKQNTNIVSENIHAFADCLLITHPPFRIALMLPSIIRASLSPATYVVKRRRALLF